MLIAIAVAGMLIAMFILFTRKKLAKLKSVAVEDILADMDFIYKPYDTDRPEALKNGVNTRVRRTTTRRRKQRTARS